MAPHIDLSKSTRECFSHAEQRSKLSKPRSSTHTWILYLSDTNESGATALLSNLIDPSSATDIVYPRRGSLCVFPHRTPHAGRPTREGAPSKLIARGELLFLE